jgi:hypothetical protein
VALSLAPTLREVREVRRLTAVGLMLRVARFNALAEFFFDMLALTRRRLRSSGPGLIRVADPFYARKIQ